jgi:antitoxin VapB
VNANHIENPEAERLIRQLAQFTGETVTEAVTTAVRERLDRLGAFGWQASVDRRVERILALADEIAPRLASHSPRRVTRLLYDKRGLPR